MAGVADEIIPLFRSARWGAVTNYAQVQLLADISALQPISADFWAEQATQDTVELRFAFYREHAGRRERVASDGCGSRGRTRAA